MTDITIQLIFMAFFFVCGVISLAATAFWIWMLVDCTMHEPDTGSNKVVWIVVIALTHFIGALLYFFIQRPRRHAAASL